VATSFLNDRTRRRRNQVPEFDWPALREAITFYESEHLVYLPARWGRKNPSLDEWEPYQRHVPTMEEKREWFHLGKPANIGVVCGDISGGLVALCFNDPDGVREFFGEERWKILPRVTFVTKSMRGHHVWLRSDIPIKSRVVKKGNNESWLEIRSDGNFTIAPPSLHPEGVLYQKIGADRIHKPDNLAGFIDKRVAELGLKAWDARQTTKEKAKPSNTERPGRTDGFNTLAIEKLLANCAFVQHCRDDAAGLPEPQWWSMVHSLAVFGEPGRKKIHELSEPYLRYTEEETERKIEEARKAADKEIGPHTCLFIEQDLGFACPENCQAKSLGAKSPAGLSSMLAAQDLRGSYFYHDKKGNLKLDMETLTKDIQNEFKFITLLDTEEVLVYDNGYWRYGGEEKIKAEAENRVGLSKLLTVHIINEIIGHIQRGTYTARALLNQAPLIINLKNGLLDVRIRELKSHTPEFLSTIRIPVAYDPNADCPRIKQFFAEVLEPQDIPIIHELVGYALIPDYSIQRAFLFIGDGGNGKSTFLNLLRIFLGRDSCSTVPWHSLEYSRFASSRLDGKLLNIYADLPSRSMNSTGTFKMLTGGDAISAEKKFKNGYSFVNFARLIFSANKPPQILDEDSYAFWRRWIIINFPNQFPENDPRTDPEILSKLTTDTELSGLLNLALDGLERLLTHSKFSYAKTVDQTQSYYLRASDPVYAFVEDCCELDPDAVTGKDTLFEAFKEYCKSNKTPLINRDSFHKALKNNPHFKVALTRPTMGGERVQSWRGIKLANSVSHVSPVNPLGVTLRDACEGDNGVKTDINKVNKDRRKMVDMSDMVDQMPTYEKGQEGCEEREDDLSWLEGDESSNSINKNIPDHPADPCPKCSKDEWAIAPDGKHYHCSNCGYFLPNPGESITPCRCGCLDKWVTPWGQLLCSRCHSKPESENNVE